ncbi:MAG: hypothetical protein P8Z76_08420 [Alphaproteobacteria bacterium]
MYQRHYIALSWQTICLGGRSQGVAMWNDLTYTTFMSWGLQSAPLNKSAQTILSLRRWVLNTAYEQLAYFEIFEPVKLKVSGTIISEVSGIVADILNTRYYDGSSPAQFRTDIDFSKETVGFEDSFRLRQAVERLENVISAELPQVAAYHPVAVGAYDVAKLVDEADTNLVGDIRGFIDERAQADYLAAGRCLAFGLSTASGFHVTRATEAVLQDYYQTLLGSDAKDDPEKWNWSQYIQALREFAKIKSDSVKPKDTTLSHLDQLRKFERNPIIHPRAVLEAETAFVLFNNCTNAILAMAQEIKEIKEGGQQKTFELGANLE